MRVGQIVKNLQETSAVSIDILRGRYPSFVYGGELQADEIPIFVFHSVEPGSFEEILQFLASNGYHTLTSEDLLELHRSRDKSLPTKSVMLTFDDGMKSVWAYAYPLLQRYGFRATTFLIPGRIIEADRCDPNLKDVWDGSAKFEDINIQLKGSYEALASWAEIKVMHDTSVIDFQSHTNRHELIFTQPEIKGFLNPRLVERYHEFEFPIECMEIDRSTGQFQFGVPLYVSAPRMSAELRYLDDAGLKQTCLDFVSGQGKSFFDGKEWEQDLSAVVADYKQRHPKEPAYESPEDREKAIYDDLSQSKVQIEAHLPGKKVNSLCFPWGVGADLSLRIAQSLGFKALYWGKIDGNLIYHRDMNPLKISRIGEDFIHLLPGEGRQSLARLVLKKVRRRLKVGSPFYTH